MTRSDAMTALVLTTALALSARCAAQDEDQAVARKRMVEEQLRGRDITDERVLRAMGRVPRHRFVPRWLAGSAYVDHALPIGSDQTISQPYIVALMTQLAELEPDDVVLEVGTGSGYQAAVLAEIVGEVYTIEIVPVLAETAGALLDELGYDNIQRRTGDGYLGWEEAAPFDAILVTAAPPSVPPPLAEQLRPGGVMVIPVGPRSQVQKLLRIRKSEDGTVSTEEIIPVVFVPLVREKR